MAIECLKEFHYKGRRYHGPTKDQKGDRVYDLQPNDEEALIRGKFAKAIKQGTVTAEAEDVSNEGPNAENQRAKAASDQSDSLACPRGCNKGKPFGSAAALAAHNIKFHEAVDEDENE